MNHELERWKEQVATKLREMISNWEARVPPESDDTLYSLALRRALDVVQTGEIPELG